jgi:hypothetical protein
MANIFYTVFLRCKCIDLIRTGTYFFDFYYFIFDSNRILSKFAPGFVTQKTEL